MHTRPESSSCRWITIHLALKLRKFPPSISVNNSSWELNNISLQEVLPLILAKSFLLSCHLNGLFSFPHSSSSESRAKCEDQGRGHKDDEQCVSLLLIVVVPPGPWHGSDCGHLLQLEMAKAAIFSTAIFSTAPARRVPRETPLPRQPAHSLGWMLRSASVKLPDLLPVIFYAS